MADTHIKLKPILICLVIIKLAATCYFFSDKVDLFNMFFGHQQAFAQDSTGDNTGDSANNDTAANPDDNTPGNSAENAGKVETEEENTSPLQPAKESESERIKAALEAMERKRLFIQEEEKRLDEKLQLLEKVKLEIEEKLVVLEKMQIQAEKKLAEKNTRESEEKRLREEEERRKIKQLVKVYSSMKPKDAAPVIEKLNIDVAKKIFMQMKGEQAGRILSYISKNRAAEISEELIAKNNRK